MFDLRDKEILMKTNYNRRIIAFSAFVGILFWFLDTTLDYFYKSGDRDFLFLLIHDYPNHEFIIRPLALLTFILFGFSLSYLSKKSEHHEIRYGRLLENIHDTVFVANSLEGDHFILTEVNQHACLNFGYEKEEFLAKPLVDLIHPDESPRLFSMLHELSKDHLANYETVMVKKDGSEINAEINAIHFSLENQAVFLFVVRDITEKKKIQKELVKSEHQLRVLTTKLMEAQEDERRRISVGLHDELGQALMHLKFRVGALVKLCREDARDVPEVEHDCGVALKYLDEIIEYVRRISRDLSPTVLEELGLTSALRYLIEEYSAHYGMQWETVDLDEIDGLFPQQTQVNIFRVFQEILINAARHSSAAMMSVDVKQGDGKVAFSVTDKGVGFEVKKVLMDSEGIGIPSMQERVRMMGGSLNITSEKGAGTQVHFEIPVELGAKHEARIVI